MKLDSDTMQATFGLMVVKMAHDLGLTLEQTLELIQIGWRVNATKAEGWK